LFFWAAVSDSTEKASNSSRAAKRPRRSSRRGTATSPTRRGRYGCLMGTSVDQINDTYRHLLPGSIERARTSLDGFLAGAVSSQVDGDGLQDRIGHQLGERGG
jgi:hypothetical protein